MAATFELLRGYFDKKFNSLTKELSEDNEAKTQSAAKRFKKDSDIKFKCKGNKKTRSNTCLTLTLLIEWKLPPNVLIRNRMIKISKR